MPPRLVFHVPPAARPYGGIKVIYDHVAALNRLGIPAFTHCSNAPIAGSFWSVDKHELADWKPAEDDIVVAPEVMTVEWLRNVKSQGCQLYLLAQSWIHVHQSFAICNAQAPHAIDGVLVVSDATEAIVRRCLPQIPCWRTPPAIEPAASDRLPDQCTIAYMPRKMANVADFLRGTWPLAWPDLTDVEWLAIDGLPHAQVLEQLRRSRYFLALQSVEGLSLPPLEAMAAGCLVAGFIGVGGREYARADNGFWFVDADGPGLLEALGQAIRTERATPGAYDAMRRAGQAMAARYSRAAQDTALERAYSAILRNWHAGRAQKLQITGTALGPGGESA